MAEPPDQESAAGGGGLIGPSNLTAVASGPFGALGVNDAYDIATAIIPRLRAQRVGTASGQAANGQSSTTLQATSLTRALVSPAFEHQRTHLLEGLHKEYLRGRGSEAFETLLLSRFTEAARALGSEWEQDQVTFSEVTLGIGRLQRLMHELADATHWSRPQASLERQSALLCAVPGEQHTFGVSMLAEFFRHEGWTVQTGLPTLDVNGSRERLGHLAGDHGFSIIGLGISSDRNLDSLGRTIEILRRRSRNPDVTIMLGGPLVAEEPDLARRFGADGAALDPREAIAIANASLAKR